MPTTSNFGWTTPADTDLVKDGAAAMRTLGNGIDTSLMDLKGGTTGQVLSKTSNTDMDFTWVTSDDANAIQNAIVDAKGDLITATAADTPARLAVGTNGQILAADSTTATGLKWIDNDQGDITAVTAGTGITGGGTSGAVTITNEMATTIDAKGDIIVGTGDNTYVRQAVGSNNQVLMADSVQADGVKWANEATATLTAKGDILTATAANTLSRLGVGSNNQVLTADSTTATGLKWAAPAGGGKVLQVVSATTTTSKNIATTTMTDTNITATITPTATTSKILILVDGTLSIYRASSSIACEANLLRGATTIGDFDVQGGGAIDIGGATYVEMVRQFSTNYLDSPNTTSATTYKIQANVNTTANSGQCAWQHGSAPSTITLLEIGA